MQVIQLIRSLVFTGLIYGAMGVMGVVYFFLTLINRDYAYTAVRHYCRVVRFFARWVIGLKSEIRGTVPTEEVLICSKHQSFFDIILIVSVAPRPKFIMKKQLVYAPVLGYFAKAIGCIPVDRGKRGAAVKKMMTDVATGAARPGQLIIFPQGTRVAAGATRPYKIGAGVIYTETGQRCIPAATNVGVFWRKHGVTRYPGTAVLEFLPAIEPGLPVETFMTVLEEAVESNSNRLMREAGFDPGSHEAD
ncbi:lysophospholipid acyltransferase family protein [Maritimibacter sp. UBA3975]|uniref:lysophospholipid acyltransferase family protein n=1 Tax=Maritimibacter sp. UBA3975 TaxID=1946833 RepID=UPI000C0ACB8C|nr:lysophospholipid acyltransferase family protein [Maritimibacter sp. UBA3975]MAM61950.1 1-acyl-sn-glycerol-3-phosphate acyltransferase [Maritimibacter sp.]|tara:strand:+ start:17376 stop:18119 length:744 start_codon:yes stop_codon:yes gene_type:complete